MKVIETRQCLVKLPDGQEKQATAIVRFSEQEKTLSVRIGLFGLHGDAEMPYMTDPGALLEVLDKAQMIPKAVRELEQRLDYVFKQLVGDKVLIDKQELKMLKQQRMRDNG